MSYKISLWTDGKLTKRPRRWGQEVKPLTLKQFQRSMDCIFTISIIVEVENSNFFNVLTTRGLAEGSKLTMFCSSKEPTLKEGQLRLFLVT